MAEMSQRKKTARKTFLRSKKEILTGQETCATKSSLLFRCSVSQPVGNSAAFEWATELGEKHVCYLF